MPSTKLYLPVLSSNTISGRGAVLYSLTACRCSAAVALESAFSFAFSLLRAAAGAGRSTAEAPALARASAARRDTGGPVHAQTALQQTSSARQITLLAIAFAKHWTAARCSYQIREKFFFTKLHH